MRLMMQSATDTVLCARQLPHLLQFCSPCVLRPRPSQCYVTADRWRRSISARTQCYRPSGYPNAGCSIWGIGEIADFGVNLAVEICFGFEAIASFVYNCDEGKRLKT